MPEETIMGKIETLLKKTEHDMEMNQRSINKAYLAGKVAGIVAVIKILGAGKR
jgi:hypothetical protein